MSQYPIRLTRLAHAIAEAKYTVAAVEAQAREEIDGLLLDNPMNLFFHCFGMPGAEDLEFICRPDEAGTTMLVDTVTFEDGEVLERGDFAGKRVQMPIPDSLD